MTVLVKIEASVTSPQVLPTLKKHYRIPMPCHQRLLPIELGAEAAQGERLCASQKRIP
jgi:hypothetical protein